MAQLEKTLEEKVAGRFSLTDSSNCNIIRIISGGACDSELRGSNQLRPLKPDVGNANVGRSEKTDFFIAEIPRLGFSVFYLRYGKDGT